MGVDMDFAVLIGLWLACGGLGAFIASSRGGNGGLGFLLGAIFGPLGVLAAFAVGGKVETQTANAPESDSKTCPMCAETVRKAALVCRFCGHTFSMPQADGSSTATIQSEHARKPEVANGAEDVVTYMVVAIGILAVGAILFAITNL